MVLFGKPRARQPRLQRVSDSHKASNFPATHILMKNGSIVICWESPPSKTKHQGN